MSDSNVWTMQIDPDGAATIRFDDGRANAFDLAGLNRLNELLDRAQRGAASVIVVGRQGYFSAGFDLNTIRSGGGELDALLRLGATTFARLLMFPMPVIAACTGHALAAGALVLLASDYRVGANGNFKLGLNEVAIGSPLPRFLIELAELRLSKAGLDAVLRGDAVLPADARAVGYLDQVVDEGVVTHTASEVARQMMRLRRGVFAEAKAALRAGAAHAMIDDLDADLALLNPRTEKAAMARTRVASRGGLDQS